MNYVTGSVTTYSYLNVMYRVYEYDLNTHQLVDIKNHIFNMTEANLQGSETEPEWFVVGFSTTFELSPYPCADSYFFRFVEYTPKKAYGFNSTTGISFQDWADLTVQFETDDELWNNYFFYNHKVCHLFPPSFLFSLFLTLKQQSAGSYGDCTGSCQTNNICKMRTTRSGVDFCSTMTSPPTEEEFKNFLRRESQKEKLC